MYLPLMKLESKRYIPKLFNCLRWENTSPRHFQKESSVASNTCIMYGIQFILKMYKQFLKRPTPTGFQLMPIKWKSKQLLSQRNGRNSLKQCLLSASKKVECPTCSNKRVRLAPSQRREQPMKHSISKRDNVLCQLIKVNQIPSPCHNL